MIYVIIGAIFGYFMGRLLDNPFHPSIHILTTIIGALVGASFMLYPFKTASREESIEEYPIYAIDESKTYLIYDDEDVRYATTKENNISQTIKVPAGAKTYVLEENSEQAYLEVHSYTYKDWWVWLFTVQSVPDDYVFHIPEGGV